MSNIYLPNILKLELTNFSLYSDNHVVMDFTKSVSCLMGANGIGKSTLLNCINYAITGNINPLNKKLKTIDNLYKGNNYHLEYFDGRIVEEDKEYATSKITFTLGENKIEVTRAFFPTNNVVEYKYNDSIQDVDNYERDIARISGLNSFSQFVFLQLKVLTFDESRDCLFWNPSILTPTIFLCLGESVERAERADELAREIQKVNSRIRNVQWEISKQTTRLTTLVEEKAKYDQHKTSYEKEDEVNAQSEYESLVKSLEETNSDYCNCINERQFVYAKITELTVEQVRLRKKYEECYSELYAGNNYLLKNPIITALTSDGCPICHTNYDSIPDCIIKRIEDQNCPLCGAHIEQSEETQEEILANLTEVDKQISQTDDELERLISRKKILDEKEEELKKKIEKFKARKEQIEGKCYSFLIDDKTDDSWDSRIKSLKDSIATIDREKSVHIEERDKLKTEYDKLCFSFEQLYNKVQIEFLPIFKKYAKEFTGLDLDMTLNPVTDDGRKMFKFILQIDDTNRDNEFELSESQRFFIDIALRMAIVTFVCNKTKVSTSMLIDTPEGSLDIAYETNAGSMFYNYVNENQNLIITANLNASGLIQTLASKTKHDKFKLISMLRWARLSSVQNAHFELFEKSISTIESRLEEK